MLLNMTTSPWAQVGDFMLRSDGTTVQPVETDKGIIWTVTLSNGQPLAVGDVHQAYTSVDGAVLVADALAR